MNDNRHSLKGKYRITERQGKNRKKRNGIGNAEHTVLKKGREEERKEARVVGRVC